MYRLSWYQQKRLLGVGSGRKASEPQSQTELGLKDSPSPKCDSEQVTNSSLVARAEDNAYLNGLP